MLELRHLVTAVFIAAACYVLINGVDWIYIVVERHGL